MTDTLALFDMDTQPADCGRCGRRLHGDACLWCAANGAPGDAGKSAALAAKSDWHRQAVTWATSQPRGHALTSEDLTAAIGLPSGGIGQHENNAVGAVMSALARAGILVHQGYVKSQRRVSHGAVLSLWVRA